MTRALFLFCCAVWWGCTGPAPVPPSTDAYTAPGLLFASPERLVLPPVKQRRPEVLKTWSFDEADRLLRAVYALPRPEGVEELPEAGRTGAGLQILGGPTPRATSVEVQLPPAPRQCALRWAWRTTGAPPPLSVRAHVQLELRVYSSDEEPDVVDALRSSPAPLPGRGWVEEELRFEVRKRSAVLSIQLEGPRSLATVPASAGEDVPGGAPQAPPAVHFDDIELSCERESASRYALLPAVEGIDTDRPVRRVKRGRELRPAVLLQTGRPWSFRVDRARPLVLRTALACGATLCRSSCGVVRVDGEEVSRSCITSPEQNTGWQELRVALDARPGQISTVELEGRRLPDSRHRDWLAWADPVLLDPEAEQSLQPDVLVVLLDGISEPMLDRELDQLPSLRRLRRSAMTYTAATTSSLDLRAAAAGVLTGRAPAAHGAHKHRRTGMSAGVTSLAQTLRQEGYDTALFATSGAVETGLEQGFGTVYRGRSRRSSALEQERSDQRVVAAFLEHWSLERDRSRPRLAVVELNTAALPFRIARGLAALQRVGMPVEALPKAQRRALRTGEGLIIPPQSDTWTVPDELRELGRAADWARLDDRLAEVMAAVPEDAVVAVVGLRGRASLPGNNQAIDAELAQVPLMVREPAIVGLGTRISRPVQSTALAPHLLHLLGLPGQSLPRQATEGANQRPHIVDHSRRRTLAAAATSGGRWSLHWRLPSVSLPSGRLRPGRLMARDLQRSLTIEPEDLPPTPRRALGRALRTWLETGLSGQTLHCPAGHGSLQLPMQELPARIYPVEGARPTLAVDGLQIPASPTADTLVVFPLEPPLTPPEGCSLRTAAPGPRAP